MKRLLFVLLFVVAALPLSAQGLVVSQSAGTSVLIGPFTVDGTTALTGYGPVAPGLIFISKNGGAFAAKNDTSTCAADATVPNYCKTSLNATDTDTPGQLVIVIATTAGTTVRVEKNLMVAAQASYAANFQGSLTSASDVTAIKTKTDQLTFGVTNQVDANVKSFNGIAGSFSSGKPDVNNAATVSMVNALTTGTITTASFTAGAIDAAAIAANALGASELATDAVTEIVQAVWVTSGRFLSGATNITASGTSITVSTGGAVKIDWSNIESPTSTQTLSNTTIGTVSMLNAATTGVYSAMFSVSGGTYASAAANSVVKQIADNSAGASLTTNSIAVAVWGLATASCAGSAGSTCASLNAATSAADPWSTAIPGAYVAGSAGYILGNQVVRTTVNNRPLDVSAGGEAGIDWGNIGSPTSTVNLSNTTLGTVSMLSAITTGGITTSSFTAGAINAAAIAADAIGASELASDAVTEIWNLTLSELAVATPSATPAVKDAIMAQYMALRNQVTVTNTLKSFYNDAGNVIFKKSLADNGTSLVESEAVSGP
jgi:hypothetical protein